MKKRVTSAILACMIFIPALFLGGLFYTLLIYVLAIQGLREIISAFENKKEVPQFIQFISYLILTLLYFGNYQNYTINFHIDIRFVSMLLLLYLLPVIIYQDEKTYGIKDAFFLIGMIILLGSGFTLLVIVRNMKLEYLLYLFIITIFTDVYALFTGMLIGKHKCVEKISPNKTWEGVFGGTLIATIAGTVFFKTVFVSSMPLYFVIIMTLFLSIISQFGDFCFSAIKRSYKIKDFSNLMPGHGGILDRFDSIFFCLFAFMFLVGLI